MIVEVAVGSVPELRAWVSSGHPDATLERLRMMPIERMRAILPDPDRRGLSWREVDVLVGRLAGKVDDKRSALDRVLDLEEVAASTERAYRRIVSRLRAAAVATDQDVAAYLAWGIEKRSWSLSTVRGVATAAARLVERGPLVSKVLRRAGRATRGRGRGQAPGLSWAEVDRLLDVLAPAGASDLRALRDAALLAVMSDALLRVSEAAAVDVADLVDDTITIPRSKTDQLGRGASCYLGMRTRGLVDRWADVAGIRTGALWRSLRRRKGGDVELGGRLCVRSVARIIGRRGEEVLGRRGLRGHSLRVGSAQELTARGASLVELQVAGRWTSPVLPAHYGRAQIAGRGAVARLRYPADGRARRPERGDVLPFVRAGEGFNGHAG